MKVSGYTVFLPWQVENAKYVINTFTTTFSKAHINALVSVIELIIFIYCITVHHNYINVIF